MPGRIIHLTSDPNGFTWSIPRGCGPAFERLLHSYLRRHVATRDGRVRVTHTRASGDGGRDFEIRFSATLKVLGLHFSAPGDVEQVVYVECKSVEGERLDDAFIVDASQHKYAEAKAYILVTNGDITPYCQYRAQEEWKRRGIEFCLVDRRRLFELLRATDLASEAAALGIALPAQELPVLPAAGGLAVKCQTQRTSRSDGQLVSLFLTVSNYGPTSTLSQVRMATDLRWSVTTDDYERVVEPGRFDAMELVARRTEFDGPAELALTLSVNGRSQRLTVTKPAFMLSFQPPFIGEGHRSTAAAVRDILSRAERTTLISIHGEAGIGKSRVVDEALEPLREGAMEVVTCHFTQDGELHRDGASQDRLGLGTLDSGHLGAVLNSLTAADVPCLLRIEDLHHADVSSIDALKRFVLEPPPSQGPLVIIVTGRDDHTFPNDNYYSFIHLAQRHASADVHSYELLPLSNQDSRFLIRAVVVDIPEPGVDRVHTLGQNNPFVITEVLQYLLDVRLARLLSRRTIGIVNPEVFGGREGLPTTVEELYERRLRALAESKHGLRALEFLTVASFFGFVIDDNLRVAYFDGAEDSEDEWELLRTRRFVSDPEAGGEATFAHENLLHHIRARARWPENAGSSARAVLDRPGIARRLSSFRRGEVYLLSGQPALAFHELREIWERLGEVTNFSSEEIDTTYFSFLPIVFSCAMLCGEAIDRLAGVALAYAYMAVHNFPLLVAESACKAAEQMLAEVFPLDADGLREKYSIRQLRSHALQNMGRTGEALKAMLETEAAIAEMGVDWPSVEFDLCDRLAEYCRKINHGELSRLYSRRARRAVDRARDDKLLANHLITESLVRLYDGYAEARLHADAARAQAVRIGVRRLALFTRVTQLVVAGLYPDESEIQLTDLLHEGRALLRDAIVECFADSIMRLELLLGTLVLQVEGEGDVRERARVFVRSGQANSLRFGNGLFDWAFDNLAAAVDAGDPQRPDEEIRRRLRSCLERLRLRGLTFVGATDGLYANVFAISNIIRFFGAIQESAGVEVLRSTITSYDHRLLEDERYAVELVRRAVRGAAILWPTPSRVEMLRYPVERGYFTPLM